jgi:hypothetical protein
MTKLDDRLIARVYALAQKYGKDLTFYNNAGDTGTYDPETGHTTPPSETTQTVKCTPPEMVKMWRDGAISADGMVKTLLPTKLLDATFFGSSFDIGTRVDFDSSSWLIEQLNPIYSGTSRCAYELVLKPLTIPKP